MTAASDNLSENGGAAGNGDHLGRVERDLNTVDAALAALNAHDLEGAEALAADLEGAEALAADLEGSRAGTPRPVADPQEGDSEAQGCRSQVSAGDGLV